MKKLLFLLLLPLAMSAQTTITKVINIPGIGNVNFTFYNPGLAQPTGAVIFFPGSGETGTNAALLAVNGPLKSIQTGWKPSFWVIGVQTPYSYGTFQNPAALPFVRGALREIISGKYNIDRSKLILAGLSWGTDHIMNYLQHEPDSTYIPIAAAIPMSMGLYGQTGSYPNDQLGGNDSRFARVPLWGFCGTSDAFYPFMSHFFVLLTKAGYYNLFTAAAGSHNGAFWNTYYSPSYKFNGLSVYDWAMQYSVSKLTNPVHARLWVDSTIIHYPTTSVLLKDSSTGASSSDFIYTVNSNDNTGRFGPAGDVSQGVLLANLVEGSYDLALVASDNASHYDTARVTIRVYGPPKCPICPVCPAPRTVKSIQLIGDGVLFPVPKSWYQVTYSDNATQ
jgi:pimeloyl-ACP methyl ester carboxylesterase